MEQPWFDPQVAMTEAMTLFWRKGYAQTSLKNLLDAMHILNGSFYNTFKSKKQVFLQALDCYAEQVLYPRMLRFKQHSHFSDGLRAFFKDMITDYTNPEIPRGCLVVNSLGHELWQDADIRQRLEKYLQELHDFWVMQLQAYTSQNQRTDLDPELLSQLLITVQKGLASASVTGMSAQEMQAQCDFLFSQFQL